MDYAHWYTVLLVSPAGAFYRHDYTPDIAFSERGPGRLADPEIGNHDIAVDGESPGVQDLLCAGHRAAVNYDPLVSAFSYPYQFPDAPANPGKARAAAVPLGGKPTRGRIRELTDIRPDTGAGVDDPRPSFSPAPAG
jgi:hypothetical protein